MLENKRAESKNALSKNATKFKMEVTMPEFENKKDISTSENSKALKHVFWSKIKSMRKKKWKNIAWPVSKDPEDASCGHSHH